VLFRVMTEYVTGKNKAVTVQTMEYQNSGKTKRIDKYSVVVKVAVGENAHRLCIKGSKPLETNISEVQWHSKHIIDLRHDITSGDCWLK
jgi:hypothetical protein